MTYQINGRFHMLKINAIKIEINTSDGLFGSEHRFSNGLNIIRGDNSSGKSSLFQSIIYGLGFEELLGGKNDKTMQSVLKDQVEFPRDTFHKITQSFIFLEIENEEIITVKRSVVSANRLSQLVDVYFGPLLTGDIKTLDSRQMYVHDPGAASDELYGYHLFLTDFLGFNLPEIVNSQGDLRKLYLQQIASAFIIEQKTGWSDFLATLPYFGMRGAEQRVIEFLLSLDVFDNQRKKQQVISDKQDIRNRWHKLVDRFQTLAERAGGKVIGLANEPLILNDYRGIYISVVRDDNPMALGDLNDQQKDELWELEKKEVSTVGNTISSNESRLSTLSDRLNQVSLNFEMLSPEVNFEQERLRQYQRQILSVQNDLRKNKGALKISKLGGDLPTQTAHDLCPTCGQELKDSLLPRDINQVPMRIEDNISYLESQAQMIKVYIDGQREVIALKENTLSRYQSQMKELRQQIRDTKKELVQDERLPSIIEIERRIELKRRVEFFTKTLNNLAELIESLKALSSEFEDVSRRESSLARDFFSVLDRRKLAHLKDSFIDLLRKFGYQSKPFNAIQISMETYLPVAQKTDADQFYNIKFDSSASDFIRCIWAYSTALLKTSIEFNTEHPRMLIFDEPKQQDISKDSFRNFLVELANFRNEQILVFASFENSDASFHEASEDLTFVLNRIEKLLIHPLQALS